MVGVGIQQGFVLLFLLFAIKFHRTVLSQSLANPRMNLRSPLILLYVVYVVLILITVRFILS